MKTRQIILSLSFILAFSVNSQAQFFEKLAKKAEEKVAREAERRAEHRVNKKIDKVFEYANNLQDEFLISAYDSTLSVNENSIAGLTLYPNPVENILTINAQEEIIKLSIYNLIGQEVKVINLLSSNFTIDVSDLVSGIYIVRIEANNKVSSKQLIKK